MVHLPETADGAMTVQMLKEQLLPKVPYLVQHLEMRFSHSLGRCPEAFKSGDFLRLRCGAVIRVRPCGHT